MSEGENSEKPTICFFGNYNPEYIRSSVLIIGLRQNGHVVYECNETTKGIKGYLKLVKQHKKIKGQYDILVVGNDSFSRSYVLLAKLLTRKPVVWDAHYSLYDAWVYDRKVVKKISPKGFYHYVLDWLACSAADLVYLDTADHKEYFVKLFKADSKKFFHIFIGANDIMFDPSKYPIPNKEGFIVEFHGKYIPLQGVPYIVKAAKLLESHKEISFKLIGRGQTYDEVIKLAKEIEIKNIEFIDRVPYPEIPKYLAEADVCLGIFGDTGKASRVIPNKLYEAVAMGKPVITGRTKAIVELFVDRENILLSSIADPEDLAEKILMLKNDTALADRIGNNTLKLFRERLTASAIASSLIKELATRVK